MADDVVTLMTVTTGESKLADRQEDRQTGSSAGVNSLDDLLGRNLSHWLQ